MQYTPKPISKITHEMEKDILHETKNRGLLRLIVNLEDKKVYLVPAALSSKDVGDAINHHSRNNIIDAQIMIEDGIIISYPLFYPSSYTNFYKIKHTRQEEQKALAILIKIISNGGLPFEPHPEKLVA